MRAEYQVPSLAGLDDLDDVYFAHDGLRGSLGQAAVDAKTAAIDAARAAALEAAKEAAKAKAVMLATQQIATSDAQAGRYNPPSPTSAYSARTVYDETHRAVSAGIPRAPAPPKEDGPPVLLIVGGVVAAVAVAMLMKRK